MLVNLTIRQWSARRRDKDVGKEVEKNHQAKDAGNFNKLLIDKEALAPIVTLAGKLRTTHYDMTLPWGDDGSRLLPAKMFFDYREAINSLRSQYDAAVQKFVDEYPTYVQNARKRLGTMYNPRDYPDHDRVAHKFSAKPHFTAVPEAKDFRVDLGEDEVREIKKDIEANVRALMNDAINDLWSRLRDCVERIHDRLSDPEAVFRDSLIENAQFVCSVASKLNVGEDQTMESIRRDIEKRLCFAAPQRLRDDKTLRKQVADSAAEIFEQLKHRGGDAA